MNLFLLFLHPERLQGYLGPAEIEFHQDCHQPAGRLDRGRLLYEKGIPYLRYN